MATFSTSTSSGVSIDMLWGVWDGTLVASPGEYRVQLVPEPVTGIVVRYLSADNSFTYSGAAGAQQPTGGNYSAVELIIENGLNVTVLARLDGFAAQPLTSVFSSPDATVMAGSDTLNGNIGADTLRGFGGDDTLLGGSGADRLYGGDGSDTFTVSNSSDIVAGEVIDGGTGGSNIDRILASGFIDLSPATLVSIERIEMSVFGPNAVGFNAAQVGGGALSTTSSIVGSADDRHISSSMRRDGERRLVGLRDLELERRRLHPDSNRGRRSGDRWNRASDTFASILGADSLYGGGGDDAFDILGSSVAGLIVDGGAGQDTLSYRGAGGDMSLLEVVSIERLVYATGGFTSLTFADVQVGAGLSSCTFGHRIVQYRSPDLSNGSIDRARSLGFCILQLVVVIRPLSRSTATTMPRPSSARASRHDLGGRRRRYADGVPGAPMRFGRQRLAGGDGSDTFCGGDGTTRDFVSETDGDLRQPDVAIAQHAASANVVYLTLFGDNAGPTFVPAMTATTRCGGMAT